MSAGKSKTPTVKAREASTGGTAAHNSLGVVPRGCRRTSRWSSAMRGGLRSTKIVLARLSSRTYTTWKWPRHFGTHTGVRWAGTRTTIPRLVRKALASPGARRCIVCSVTLIYAYLPIAAPDPLASLHSERPSPRSSLGVMSDLWNNHFASSRCIATARVLSSLPYVRDGAMSDVELGFGP
jgi:hypothetical protein